MTITIKDKEKYISVKIGERRLLSDILRENGFQFSMPCGGRQVCGKCRVHADGCLSEPSEKERSLLANESDNGIRYACMTYALGDAHIELINKDSDILSEGFLSGFSFSPEGRNYGFAVDIGTTTVAVYGYDLKNGTQLCKSSFINPQIAYGADVISRIQTSLGGKDMELQCVLSKRLERAVTELCDANGIPTEQVDLMVITGNTTMLCLLTRKDVSPLSSAPFAIKDYFGEMVTPELCGLSTIKNATVYLPRAMSAFVGSDITCAVLAARDLLMNGEATMLVDMGTNGEMALYRGGKLLCCSTAAGPAFEGTGITMGSMAVHGAINKVYFEDNRIKYTTIAGHPPCGICGSGLIDTLAAFLSQGLIDSGGGINTENKEFARYITDYAGKPALLIGDSEVFITQSDIRAAQLAKAAVCAGIYSLLEETQTLPNNIERLIIAGGFGSFIDAKNAAAIGLIPKELSERTTAVGNAAAAGASMILQSRQCRLDSDEIAKKAQSVDLSTSRFFMDRYIDCMSF